jgi:hypothetical protein
MKKATLLLPVLLLCLSFSSRAQLLKKIKDKANSVVNNSTTPVTTEKNTTTESSSSTSSSGTPKNTKGGGLTNTVPPDVSQQIADAEKSHADGNLSDARYSIQQALMSIELQIGKEVLKSLPPTVSGLEKDTTQNKVMSTQWGWNNLTIQSVYKKDDRQLTITIGNNILYSSLASTYFNNAMYMQANSDGEKQNVKQTKVKGNKAIITYDDDKGYTLMVPLGQSALIVWECINFASENDVMNAANAFDIDGIKKMLGEK